MLTEDELALFRRHIWHKTTHVFPSAIEVDRYALSAESICRLTEKELVESRLISSDYSLTLGPFELDIGDDGLIPAGCLLMAHSLEAHFEEIDKLLRDYFSFIPRWQIDDVMASVGDSGASCGPHFDRYDVFLLQLQGEKKWRFDTGGHAESDLRRNAELRLLDKFEEAESHLLSAGDVLYIPPGVGHWGICGDDSVTLSVGIRNPSLSEFAAELSEFLLTKDEEHRLLDDGLHASGPVLSGDAIDAIGNELKMQLTDRERLQEWYGSYVTRLREPELIVPILPSLSASEIRAAVAEGSKLKARLPSRLCYVKEKERLLLYANGEQFAFEPGDETWIMDLCRAREALLATSAGDSTLSGITDMINDGILYFDQTSRP